MINDIVEGSTDFFELPKSASIGLRLVDIQKELSSPPESLSNIPQLLVPRVASTSFSLNEDGTEQTSPTSGTSNTLGDSQFFSDVNLPSPIQTPRQKNDLKLETQSNESDSTERENGRIGLEEQLSAQKKENELLRLQLQESIEQNAILLKKIEKQIPDQSLDKLVVECKQDAQQSQDAASKQKNSDQIPDIGFVPIVIPRDNTKLTEQSFKAFLKKHVQGEQEQNSDTISNSGNWVSYDFVAETFNSAREGLASYLKINKLSYKKNVYWIIVQYKKIRQENTQLDVPCFIYKGIKYEIHDWQRIELTFHGSFRTVPESIREEKAKPKEKDAFLSTLETIRNDLCAARRNDSIKGNSLSCLEKVTATVNINVVKVQLEEEIKSCNTSSFYGQKSYLCNFFPSVSLRLRSKVARKEIKLKFLNELLNKIENAEVNTTIGDIVNKLAFEYKNKSESEWNDVKAGISSERLGISTSKTFNLLKSLGYDQKIVDELMSQQQLRAASQ